MVDEGMLSIPAHSKLMCIGTLERAQEDEVHAVGVALVQTRKQYVSSPMVLRVIFAKVDDDLDLRLWASSARKIREAFSAKSRPQSC